MQFCRIDLKQTNYSVLPSDKFRIVNNWDYGELNLIYKQYCKHKNFSSVMPVFYEDFRDCEIFGYYDQGKLVAWSLIIEYPSQLSVSADQFAWDYANPKLHLGIASLRNECAYYKQQGYEYLYLDGADDYKRQIDGFEILGPVHDH